MKNLKISETSPAKRVVKFMLAGSMMFTSAFALIGCSNKKNSQGDNPTGEVEISESNLTPLQKEIKALDYWDTTDKVYDNKDLELFNKAQLYLYSVKTGMDTKKMIETVPPENISEFDKFSQFAKYTYVSRIIVPTRYLYSKYNDAWTRVYPGELGETDINAYQELPVEYQYRSYEELSERFGKNSKEEGYQFQLKP